MKNNNGWIVLALGSVTLSLEIFFLKFVQLLDRHVTHMWSNYIDYIAMDGSIFLAFFISAVIILCGLILIMKGK